MKDYLEGQVPHLGLFFSVSGLPFEKDFGSVEINETHHFLRF